MATSVAPRLLTVAETAEALRVSERTVRRLIANGVLPAVQLRRRGAVRVDADELERLCGPTCERSVTPEAGE